MSFTASHLFFDDVEVGQEWESQGRTVTETDIVNFAGISGDFNPIHTDHEFCKTTPYRKPIAHGLLVFSIGSGLGIYSPMVRTLAFLGVREWTFRGPVFVGDTLRIRGHILQKSLRGRSGRRGELVWRRTIINQDGKVVQEGVLITLVEARGDRPVAEAVGAGAMPAAQPGL
ncbi:MAG: MaoC/PaaZ C-terminal domain-containing protein [Gemmataceae bacterium]